MELARADDKNPAKVRGLNDDESLNDNEVDEYFNSQQSRLDEEDGMPADRIRFRLKSRASEQPEVSKFEEYDLKKNKLVKFGKLRKRSPRKRKEAASAAVSGDRVKESKANLDQPEEQGLLKRDKSVRFISNKNLGTNFESDPSLRQGRAVTLLDGHRS